MANSVWYGKNFTEHLEQIVKISPEFISLASQGLYWPIHKNCTSIEKPFLISKFEMISIYGHLHFIGWHQYWMTQLIFICQKPDRRPWFGLVRFNAVSKTFRIVLVWILPKFSVWSFSNAYYCLFCTILKAIIVIQIPCIFLLISCSILFLRLFGPLPTLHIYYKRVVINLWKRNLFKNCYSNFKNYMNFSKKNWSCYGPPSLFYFDVIMTGLELQ